MIVQTIEYDEGLSIHLQVINARVIRVISNTIEPEVTTSTNDGIKALVKLNFNGFILSVGQEITIKNGRYKIQNIIKSINYGEDEPIGYELYINQLNKSSHYILPLLSGDRAIMKWNETFINCFIGTEAWGVTETIYLWYRFDGSKENMYFEEFILRHPNYINTHDIDKYHVLYEFSVPEKYKADYYLLIDGKYSKIKELTKKKILDFHSSTKNRPMGKILYRDIERKKELERELLITIPDDIDLLDPFYEKDEIFLNKYIISDVGSFNKEE